MNKTDFRHPKINHGKPLALYIPVSAAHEATFRDQIAEIFIEQHYAAGKIKKNMTIIDCGANIGSASLYFKDWAKVIYALEPNPRNYECLVENTKKFSNIKPFCVGLAARTTTEFMRNEANYPIAESLFGTGDIKEEVKLLAIDEFMKSQGIDHVDLLKMDTEGAEYVIFPSYSFGKVADKIDYIVGEAHYFYALVPEYIPLILADCGFDTKFMPINNMYLKMSFDDDVVKKNYELKKQTIFFAKRKELPWPKN